MTTQQTKWGPEIPVNGKRPEWLEPSEKISGVDAAGIHPWYKGAADSVWAFDWSNLVSFRLPVDHPHYAEVNGNSRTPTLSPELTARMDALVRQLAGFSLFVDNEEGVNEAIEEARAIAALLEPVDPDASEAERIAYDMEGALPRDLVEAGIKAGRKMEADERNAALKRKWDDAHGSSAIAGRALAEAGK